jgi:YesN/AraC family two-component response regulator
MASVLVIDDDLLLRKLLCRIIKKDQGHAVHDAANGKEGLELISKFPVDLVVTDIFMPAGDGLGTIMNICHNFPDVKIIAMSGGGNVEDVDFLQLASCLGAQKVFHKPFDTEEFLSSVKSMLH